MFTANESQTYHQSSARNSSYLDNMAFPQFEKNCSLPFFPLPKHRPDVAFPGQSASNLPGLNTDPQDAVSGFLKPISPCCNISNPMGNPYPKDSQNALSHGLGLTDKPFDAPQKRFLIFDQSGNHTRLFLGPSFSPQGSVLASKTPASGNHLADLVGTRADQRFLMKSIVEEKWDENHLTDEEDGMLEDTEEIDALLFSDSDDDDYDDNDGENDEVTSTRRSPLNVEEAGNNKDKSLDELTEQVASCDEENSPKRRRLVDSKYKKSSFDWAEIPTQRAISSHCEDDVESSCAGYRNPCDDTESNKRENKVKIHQALKILETIIPGLDSKDPISIIDKAVTYLKSMKTEAEALGRGYYPVPYLKSMKTEAEALGRGYYPVP